MSIGLIVPSKEDSAQSIKSMLQSWIESTRPDVSTADLATLYSTSVAAFMVANIRANVISRIALVPKLRDSLKPLPSTHPLVALLKDGYRKRMKDSEISMYAWGRNLVYKTRSPINPERYLDLIWVNPTIYAANVNWQEGLRGFDIYRYDTRQMPVKVRFIPIEDAIYTTYLNFYDEFDGTAPLEVAFMHANLDAAIAEMGVSTFRNMAIPAAIIQPAEDANIGQFDTEEGKKSRTNIANFLRQMTQGVRNAGRTIITPRRWQWIQLQQDLDKIAMKDTSELAQRRVFEAAEVPYELVSSDATTYASAYVKYRAWYDMWIEPTAEWYAEEYTRQLAEEYGDDIILEPDFSKLGFLKEDTATKTTYVNQQVAGTLRTLKDAQKVLDIEPDEALDGMYIVQGVPVHRDDLKDYWKQKGAAGGTSVPLPGTPGALGLPPGGQQPGQQLGQASPLTPQPSPQADASKPDMLPQRPDTVAKATFKTSSDGTPSGCVLVSLMDWPPLVAVQTVVRDKLGATDLSEAVRWTPPEQYHITLVYAPLVDQEAYRRIYEVVKNDIHFFRVKAGPMDVFEQDDMNVLILRVEMTDDLRALQRKVYDAFIAESVPVSEYSLPENWQAHITLGYVSKDVELPFFIETIDVPISNLVFSRDNYEVIHDVVAPINGSPAFASAAPSYSIHTWIPDTVMEDFKRWRTVVGRKGAAYEFEARELPADTRSFLRLMLLDGEGDEQITGIFIQARRHYIRHHSQGLKAYGETATRYRAALYDLVTSFLESRVDRKQFGDAGRAEISTALRAGFMEGLREGGVNTDTPDPDEERDLMLEIKAERGYWTALANEINRSVLPLREQARTLSKQAHDTTDPAERDRLQTEALTALRDFQKRREDLIGRIDVWVNKGLRRLYDQGTLSAKSNEMLTWVYGKTEEHCKTCSKAVNQIHRAKDWKRRGILPRTDVLDCGGFKCDCSLEPTTEKARGRLDRIPLADLEGKHDHEQFMDAQEQEQQPQEVEPVPETEGV